MTEQVEPDRSVEDAPVGIEKVLDYGARERREIQMDLFARELLLPRSMVRHLHVSDGRSSTDISTRLGAPLQPPHLDQAGYRLVGGRLLPGDSG